MCVCVCVKRVTAASLQHTAANSELCGNWDRFPRTTEAGQSGQTAQFQSLCELGQNRPAVLLFVSENPLNNILRLRLCFQQHIHDPHCLHNVLQTVQRALGIIRIACFYFCSSTCCTFLRRREFFGVKQQLL